MVCVLVSVILEVSGSWVFARFRLAALFEPEFVFAKIPVHHEGSRSILAVELFGNARGFFEVGGGFLEAVKMREHATGFTEGADVAHRY